MPKEVDNKKYEAVEDRSGNCSRCVAFQDGDLCEELAENCCEGIVWKEIEDE